MTHLISVIVPVYNVSVYLKKCVESILNQTFTNIELILVDDGSTDSGPGMCDEFAVTDSRVKVIHQKNQGLSAARNAGLDLASGDYIAFVDGDDYLREDMLEKMYERLVKDQSELAICDICYVDQNYREIIMPNLSGVQDGIMDESDFWDALYHDKPIFCTVACNKLYHKSLFNDARYRLGKVHEDEFIIHEIVSRVKKISILRDKFYFYLQREGSITQKAPSIGKLDKAEAAIERSYYFYHRGWQNLAEMSLIRCAGIILNDCKDIRKTAAVQARIKQLHILYRNAYREITKGKNTSLRFKINGFQFYLAPWVYKVSHFYKK